MNSLNIFRPGRHVANSGQAIEFSQADLEATAKAYNTALHEAPLVVGHPKADAPAYGWVKSLSFSDGGMCAEASQVDAEFQEMVNSGRFKKLSASFYLPDAPQNPVPGVYYLRHVGFLGAQPPAVKGLKDAQFAEKEEGVVEFGDYGDDIVAEVLDDLREWMVDRFGIEDADRAIPKHSIERLEEFAREPDVDTEAATEYSEVNDLKTREAQLAARAAELDRRESALKSQALKAKVEGIAIFCEGLTREGKLAPCHVRGAVSFMASLDDETSVDFGEQEKETPLAWFRRFLQAQPKRIDFSETKGEMPPTSVNFVAAPGYTVDACGLELHSKALAYQKANPGTDYFDAVKAIN